MIKTRELVRPGDCFTTADSIIKSLSAASTDGQWRSPTAVKSPDFTAVGDLHCPSVEAADSDLMIESAVVKQSPGRTSSRVLIIFPGALGDLICLGPAIRAIQARNPGRSIELMARAELA